MKLVLSLLDFLSDWIGTIGRFLGGLWRWLTADWRNGPLFLLFLLAVVHLLILDPGLRRQRDQALADLAAEQKAHAETVANHRAAARQAEQAQQQNLARVKAEALTINERELDDYKARLADLRARYAVLAGGLQPAAPATGPGLSGAAAMPGTGASAGRAAAAPPDDGFPSAGVTCTPMNLEERLIASEQALQLDKLIDAVEALGAIDTNPIEVKP